MTLIDRFDTTQTDPAIITRSDHSPTDCERYGDWARKFFGYGCHQEYKDSDTTLMRMSGLVNVVPVRQ